MAHRNAETETESGVRVGPALFITKLMMTYAPFTRYFTRSLNKIIITLFADRMYTHTHLSREDKALYQYTVQESTDEYCEAFVSSCTFPLLSYFHRSPCR